MSFFEKAAHQAAAAKVQKVPAPQPWVEKYRPKTIEDVAHQDEVVSVLRKTIESNNLPHLLFYGPPGTGKTSTILALARELYGPELFKSRVMELNASDERGISVVREKIKTFAQVSIGEQPKGSTAPPFKIIILDEADTMTNDAQSALRRTMEQYSKITRFCLVCNYVSRIIEPITSRCAKFRFKLLDGAVAKARLEHICKSENITIESSALDTLLASSHGDLRKAINFLQSAAKVYAIGNTISSRNVVEITGIIPDEVVEDLWKVTQSGDFDKVQTWVNQFVSNGFSASQLLFQLHSRLLSEATLSNAKRSALARRISETDAMLTGGADEHLQILNLSASMLQVMVS